MHRGLQLVKLFYWSHVGMLQDTGLKIAAPVSFLSTLLSMWHLENGSAVLTVKKLDVSIDWFLLSPYNGPISQW